MTSIKETVEFLGRVILIRVGGLISDSASQKVRSLEKELADMSSDLERTLSAAEAFAERMEVFHALYLERTGLLAEVRGQRDAARAELERMRGALREMVEEFRGLGALNTGLAPNEPSRVRRHYVIERAEAALSSGPALEAAPETNHTCGECGRRDQGSWECYGLGGVSLCKAPGTTACDRFSAPEEEKTNG